MQAQHAQQAACPLRWLGRSPSSARPALNWRLRVAATRSRMASLEGSMVASAGRRNAGRPGGEKGRLVGKRWFGGASPSWLYRKELQPNHVGVGAFRPPTNCPGPTLRRPMTTMQSRAVASTVLALSRGCACFLHFPGSSHLVRPCRACRSLELSSQAGQGAQALHIQAVKVGCGLSMAALLRHPLCCTQVACNTTTKARPSPLAGRRTAVCMATVRRLHCH